MSPNSPPVLDRRGDGPFHLDSPIGRILHPGTRSYRERAAVDSVHVAVHPDHRVTVHIDRVCPLVVRPGRRCRYSALRALAHAAVAFAEAVARLARRQRAGNRCELDCRIVWVPDDEDWVEPDEDGDDAGGLPPAA